MPDEMFPPFAVKYEGRDADRHVMEGGALAESLAGSTRLYNAVAHYSLYGFVPRGRYRKTLTVYAQAPAPGSWEQFYYIAPFVAGQYALGPALYNEAVGFIFGKVLDSVKTIWTRRTSESVEIATKLADVLLEQSRTNAQVQTTLADGLVRAHGNLASLHGKLIETLPQLATATRHYGIQQVEPIGVTCSSLRQLADTPVESQITEPEAEAIRAGRNTEVDPVATFHVQRISALNVDTGTCGLDVENIGHVKGTITDPVLKTPNNIYTRSMNDHTPCVVRAKAVKKDGQVQRLYISDSESDLRAK